MELISGYNSKIKGAVVALNYPEKITVQWQYLDTKPTDKDLITDKAIFFNHTYVKPKKCKKLLVLAKDVVFIF